jgi:hypothetical protein
MGDLTITEDGKYPLKHKVRGDAGDRTVAYVSGEFGTAIATLCYVNGKGDNIPLTEGEVESGHQYYIEPGSGITIYLIVTDSNGDTDIDVLVRGLS